MRSRLLLRTESDAAVKSIAITTREARTIMKVLMDAGLLLADQYKDPEVNRVLQRIDLHYYRLHDLVEATLK